LQVNYVLSFLVNGDGLFPVGAEADRGCLVGQEDQDESQGDAEDDFRHEDVKHDTYVATNQNHRHHNARQRVVDQSLALVEGVTIVRAEAYIPSYSS